jgi:RNA polymerase sigma factor (sigma-70 family)
MPAGPVEWSEVLPAVQQGQESAAEVLYRAFCDLVRPRVTRAVGADYADDVIHDAFMRILQAVRRGLIRHPGAMYAIMAKTAHRQTIDHWRKRTSCPGVPADTLSYGLSWIPDKRDPERIAAARERLDRALAAMQPEQQEAVLAIGSNRQVAEKLGTTPGTVRMRRYHGRRLARLAA